MHVKLAIIASIVHKKEEPAESNDKVNSYTALHARAARNWHEVSF